MTKDANQAIQTWSSYARFNPLRFFSIDWLIASFSTQLSPLIWLIVVASDLKAVEEHLPWGSKEILVCAIQIQSLELETKKLRVKTSRKQRNIENLK